MKIPEVGIRSQAVNLSARACKPSFQKLIAWIGRGHDCNNCKTCSPHEHSERLNRLYPDKTIFACEDGDISFAKPEFMAKVFEVMCNDRKKRNWLMQSKNPGCFKQYLSQLPENTYLITTFETNRDTIKQISKAPLASKRLCDFKALQWDNKFVTVEPIMDFDLEEFADMILSVKPKCVFICYNSKPDKVKLPEPSKEKTMELILRVESKGVKVLTKNMLDPFMMHYQYKEYFENNLSPKPTIEEIDELEKRLRGEQRTEDKRLIF
jgi:hypothetical protein